MKGKINKRGYKKEKDFLWGYNILWWFYGEIGYFKILHGHNKFFSYLINIDFSVRSSCL